MHIIVNGAEDKINRVRETETDREIRKGRRRGRGREREIVIY